MSVVNLFLIFILLFIQLFQGHMQADIRAGRGDTSDPILLQDNYIPAAMQIIFYLTDNMKFDLKPASSPISGSYPTSTTVRPTAPHKPGNYAPEKPLGPQHYFSKNLRSRLSQLLGVRYADGEFRQELEMDLELLGQGPKELLHQINSLGDFDSVGDEDADVMRFVVNYDDNLELDYLRQKRVPPTRAYVTLLSLYDLLNKEAKEKGLNKYGGYNDNVIRELAKTSEGTSEDQLRIIMNKMIEKRSTRQSNILKKSKALLEDLNKPDSYLCESLRYIPPLQFLPINP